MNNLLTMKPTFLEDAELLLLGIGDDDELKKYLAADYKFDDKEIKKGVKSFEKARDADADFEETVGDQAKEKAAFEELFEQAEAWVEKHSECLQIAMEDCFQSHFIHFFVQQSPFMPLSEWFTRYTEMYYRILSDRSVMAEMTLIGRNQKEFEKGLNSVLNAMEAWEKLEPKDKEGQALFEKRNEAFEELTNIFRRVQTFCSFIFAEHPELLDKPSVSNLSPIVFAKMVKDSSITRKILLKIEDLFKSIKQKYFDPGTTWKALKSKKTKEK